MKIRRIIGCEGRVTIPHAMRQVIGFREGDVVSFCLVDEDTVLVRRETLRASEEKPAPMEADTFPSPLWEELTEKQRHEAKVYMHLLWAQSHGGKPHEGCCK